MHPSPLKCVEAHGSQFSVGDAIFCGKERTSGWVAHEGGNVERGPFVTPIMDVLFKTLHRV